MFSCHSFDGLSLWLPGPVLSILRFVAHLSTLYWPHLPKSELFFSFYKTFERVATTEMSSYGSSFWLKFRTFSFRLTHFITGSINWHSLTYTLGILSAGVIFWALPIRNYYFFTTGIFIRSSTWVRFTVADSFIRLNSLDYLLSKYNRSFFILYQFLLTLHSTFLLLDIYVWFWNMLKSSSYRAVSPFCYLRGLPRKYSAT